MLFEEQIQTLENLFVEQIATATSLEHIEHIRLIFLGRQGHLSGLMEKLKELSLEDKKNFGPIINNLKQHIQHWYTEKKDALNNQLNAEALKHQQYFDVTASKYESKAGSLHIYTRVIQQIEDIFISMGYRIVDGPEVETDFYNFEALNIPSHHPARDSQDTFWLNIPGMLLRTHTSSVQTHIMETEGAPLAVCAPGRVYRNEATDASHDFMFTQTEALFINKNVSMAHLLSTVRTFLQRLFNRNDIQVRVRPGYFPFVEPGVDIDASCPFCKHGCTICKKTQWIELMGAGLVHPRVLQSSNINPEIYSGFAFGCGVERIAMLIYGISDVRLFHANNLSFLNQFK